MERTLEWSAPDGAPRRARLESPAGPTPLPAALIAVDDAAAEFARRLTRALLEAGWCGLELRASALGAAHGDRARAAELEAALTALAGEPELDADRLALVGVGALGTQAFLCACTGRRAAAVVDVCGPLVHASLDAERPVQPLDMVLNLGVPALIVHADEDERFGVAQASAAVARIERALRSVERVGLPGRAADFLDPTASGYHAERAERAARSIADFLRAVSDE